MKKQLVCGALVGAMVAATLTGCGGSSSSTSSDSSSSTASEASGSDAASGSVDLVFAWWGNQVRNERTQNAIDEYQNENEGVTVQGQFNQWSDYWQKLATSSAGNALPDIIQMDYKYINQYVNSGELLDLTPYIESGAFETENIPENVLSMGTVGDGIYGIPSGVTGSCMYYNKAVTDACGITIEPNITYDEFVEDAKIIYEQTGYRVSMFTSGNYLSEYLRGQGTPFTEAKLPVDVDGLTAFFQLQEDGIAEGWAITPDCVDETATETDPLVYGSSPEMMSWASINGSSNLLTSFRSSAPEGADIQLMTIPTADPQKSNYLKPSMFFSISAKTEHPDEAVAFLNYLINSEACNKILLGERGVPANTKIVEAIQDEMPESDQEAMQYVTDVVTPNCSPIDPPDPDGWNEFLDSLKKQQEAIGYKSATAAEAAQTLYDTAVSLWGE